jgi:hypothetical protein
MKTYLGPIAGVVAALMLAAVCPTNARGGGGFGGGSGEPPVYSGDDHDCYQASYYYEDNPPRCYLDPFAAEYPPYYGREYLVLGYDSGKALRLKTISQNWLVDYMRANVMDAPLNGRDDFRRGFVSGYGAGATSVLKEAIQEARESKPQANTAAGGEQPDGLTTERSVR